MENQHSKGRYITNMILLCGLTIVLFTWVATLAEASSPNRFVQIQSSLSKSFIVNQDAFVSSGFPDNVHGKLPGLLVGRSNRPTSIHPYAITQMLLEFEVGEIMGAEILETKLRLYPVYYESIDSGDPPVDLSLWIVTQPWDESTVKWLTKPSISTIPISTVSAGVETDRWIDIQIPAAVVKDWVEHPGQNHGLLINAPSVESSGGQIRNYRSREYGTGEFAPQLLVTYQLPTPTPTPTHTPTPTPGVRSIALRNQPTGEIIPGAAVTFAISLENGQYPLSGLVITTTAPSELVILNDTVDNGALQWQHQIQGQRITWTLDQTLPPNARDQLHYQAARPTPTLSATPTTLAITKRGPQFVAPGELITYTLHVDNQTPYTLTGVTITDTLPAALTLVDPGGALTTTLPAQLVWQEVAPLVSGATLTRSFSGRPVAAVSEVVNADYQVQATIAHSDTQEAITALGALSVTTIVTTTPAAMLSPVIINAGACVRWQYAVPGEPFQTGIQCSGPTFNPLRAQWLPFVSR